MATTIPASVSRRKRLILAGDIFLGLAIVAAALHFSRLACQSAVADSRHCGDHVHHVAAPVHSAPRRSHYGDG